MVNKAIREVTLPVFIVLNCCRGTFSAARACMLLPQHKPFVGGDLVVECMRSSLSQLALKVAQLVLNEESDITGEETVPQSEMAFVKTMDAMDENPVLMHGRHPPDFLVGKRSSLTFCTTCRRDITYTLRLISPRRLQRICQQYEGARDWSYLISDLCWL